MKRLTVWLITASRWLRVCCCLRGSVTASACLVFLTATPVASAQRIVSIQSDYLSHKVKGISPDNRFLLVASERRAAVYDLENDRVVWHDELGPDVFEPLGMVGDGKWVVGGGRGLHRAVHDARASRSLYLCPLQDYIGDSQRDATRIIDLTPILPLERSPLAEVMGAVVVELDRERFALMLATKHRPASRTSKTTSQLVVVSLSDARIVSARDCDGKWMSPGRRVGDYVSAIEQLEVVWPPRRRNPAGGPARIKAFPQATTLRQVRIPLDDSQPIEEGRVRSLPGAATWGEDCISVFGIRPYIASPYIASLNSGAIRPLGEFPPALNHYDSCFSPDCRLLAVTAAHRVIREDRRGFMTTRPADRILIYDVASGRCVKRISLDNKYTPTLECFSDDNRLLVVHLATREGDGPGFVGYQLWDLSESDAVERYESSDNNPEDDEGH